VGVLVVRVSLAKKTKKMSISFSSSSSSCEAFSKLSRRRGVSGRGVSNQPSPNSSVSSSLPLAKVFHQNRRRRKGRTTRQSFCFQESLFSHGVNVNGRAEDVDLSKNAARDDDAFALKEDKGGKGSSSLIGRRAAMSSSSSAALFVAVASSSSSLSYFCFPARAGATPQDIEWGAPGLTKRAFKFDVPLRVNVLRGTIPPNVFEDFKETQASPRLKLEHSASASLAKSFQDLRRGRAILEEGGNGNDYAEEESSENSRNRNSSDQRDKKGKKKLSKTAATATLATLGDAYLKAAIREKLILPFEITGKERWFRALPDVYKNLCFRDYRTGDIVRSTDPNGRLFAVPYRVTATLLAYRADKLPRGVEAITDWTDVFDPRFGNKTFVGCADAPREVLSAALKMGDPRNTINPKTIDNERSQRDALRRLRAKIKVSDDETYLRALQNGDISVAFGGSDDVLALCRRSSLVKPVFPPSGTALHCDVFVRPVLNEGGGYTSSVPNSAPSSSPGIDAWLDFMLDSGRINERGGLRSGLNPIQFDGDRIYGGRSSQDDVGDIFKGWLPDDMAWSNSEFVLPLSDAAIRAYEDISREI